jgi:hypothetical protein
MCAWLYTPTRSYGRWVWRIVNLCRGAIPSSVVSGADFVHLRIIGFYTIVEKAPAACSLEGDQHPDRAAALLPVKIGPRPSSSRLGRCHVLDMRLDQQYLRSQPVNSEEGAPMGIGIWYEMYISDPVRTFSRTSTRGDRSAQRQQRRGASRTKLGTCSNPPR